MPRDDFRDYGGSWYQPSRPRKAVGGIKAQSSRGSFGESWWAKRWIAVLESFQIGSRLNRGRAYARQGQVLSIQVDAGEVRAEVQGSRPEPYQVSIELMPHSEEEWTKVAEALRKEARFVAELLSGRMPKDVEQAFLEAGAPLFPQKLAELETACSCPDASNPCKHIAAVYYLLGEEFDRDPFLLFLLRGMPREELTPLLAPGGREEPEDSSEPLGDEADDEAETVEDFAAAPPEPAVAPLPSDPAEFWKTTEFPAEFYGSAQTPLTSAALPRRLGSFPFWRGEARFFDALEPLYRAAAPAGVELFMGDGGPPEAEADDPSSSPDESGTSEKI